MGIWDFKTFECAQNPVMCLWAWCVPCGSCCMQAIDAKISDPENKNAALIACLFDCFLCCIGATINRMKLRKQMSIEDSVAMDFLCSCCCGCCSVTQEWMTTMKRYKNNHKTLIWALDEKSGGEDKERA
ncbi:unnamed protein product [Blepharisma stoltei]|uniref:PLAC8 family protein n=1 Tax=Blepharisma stoltei TaxID=1481888 RepID=A0AAU9IG26_9CILI|nr:unnamed protein product [Blepharisma stoltei]